jgi:tetratricopeptide (TPR) repeat protein
MSRIEKSVFISYRRADGGWLARAVWTFLNQRGFDAFFDIKHLGSGDFEQAILGNVKERAHFVALLTPACLERIDEPGDLFRREIETALDNRRNIVPLICPGFSFSDAATAAKLAGKLRVVPKYNCIQLDFLYFEPGMERLTEFLSVPIETVLHPLLPAAATAAVEQKAKAEALPPITREEFMSGILFSLAHHAHDPKRKVEWYTKAIELKPDYAGAYNNRGMARLDLMEMDSALADFDRAIELDPGDPGWYLNRGVVLGRLRRDDEALADLSEALRLRPEYPEAYSNRALVHVRRGNDLLASNDFDRAVELKPGFENALYERAQLKERLKNYRGAIADFQHYLAVGGPLRQPDHDQVLLRIQQLRELSGSSPSSDSITSE